MKVIYSILLLNPFILIVNTLAQSNIDNTVEEKAFQYFCEYVLVKEEAINKMRIVYKEKTTNGQPSSIYKVADCIGDINWIRGSIPNPRYLDSLEDAFSKTNYLCLKVDNSGKKFAKYSFLNRNSYRLFVFNTIEYKQLYCVEFLLINKYRTGDERCIIIVFLDKKNLAPLNYCKKQYSTHNDKFYR